MEHNPGNGEISQAVMIVPDPNNPDRYYIFTNSGSVMGFSGLYYSVVDMSLNGGLGDIDIAQKNVLVSEDVTKNITAVLNPNDNTYWIIIFGYMNDSLRNDTFSTYKLDQTGINLVNQSTFTFNLNESNNINGSMKVSPDGQSLALIYNTIGNEIEGEFDDAQSLFVFDFDSTTGMISQLDDSILLNDHLYAYGLEFSPDSNLLYVSATNKLSEKSGTVGRIFQVTYRDIGKTSTLIYEGREPIYGIQIGVGDKIYAVNSSGNLGVINSPNIIGTDANYIHGEIDLSPSRAIRELPPLVPQEEITEPPFDICETIKVKNPFKKKLMIQFDIEQIYMVSLFNSSGVLEIFETHDAAIDKKLNINTSSLPSGIYFLNIKTEQLVTCTRTLIRK